MGSRYRANEPRFVDETIDGEALVMDMVRGNYYSCAGASAVAWNALKAGFDADEVSAQLVNHYGIAPALAADDLESFVTALLAEEMLVESDAGAPQPPPAVTGADTGAAAGGYEGLCLERHTDLADLILLDPVHDVSEAGWPHRAE